MSTRQGGKLKPLKVVEYVDGDIADLTISQAPKKDKKEETEDEKAFKEKKKADAEALKTARDKGRQLHNCGLTRLTCAALKGGPLVGGGIKK